MKIVFAEKISPAARARYCWIAEHIICDRLNIDGVTIFTELDRLIMVRGDIKVEMPNLFIARSNEITNGKKDYDGAGFVRSIETIPVELEKYLFCCFHKKITPTNQPDDIVAHNYDFLGCAFYTLSRFEEWVSDSADRFGRFPANESDLVKFGLIDIPIVDEIVSFLGEILMTDLEYAEFTNKRGKTIVSCDVDWPFGKEQSTLIRLCMSIVSAFTRKDENKVQLISRFIRSKFAGYSDDKYSEAIRWILDVNEKTESSVEFYFIPYSTSKRFDSEFNFHDKGLLELIQSISRRGHHIGLHPGFYTCSNEKNFSSSLRAFIDVRDRCGVDPNVPIISRQHYLKWNPRQTISYLQKFDVSQDSSLGFGDTPGFRCGTSHKFRLFNLEQNKATNVIELPLIVMDSGITQNGYGEHSYRTVRKLKEACYRHGGCFTVLWHNSNLFKDNDKKIYQYAISKSI